MNRADPDCGTTFSWAYGESPLLGAVLGSTPHKLLRLSKVPVLAVPA